MIGMERGSFIFLVALTSALAICALGCGGSGGSDVAVGTLSKQEFLEKANAICLEGKEEMMRLDAAAWKKYDPNPDPRSKTKAIEDKVALALLPAWETELRRLRALGLPRGDERYVERLLLAWEDGIEIGRRHPRLLWGGGSHFAFARAYEMSLAYGVGKCWLS